MSDEVKPWDLLNPNEPRSDEETRAARLEICRGCEHFKKRFERCALCGCFMDVKVLLGRASCPIGKW